MSFPRYPKYKPSGVEWLGEVPDKWDVQRMKRLGNIRYGIGEPPRYRDVGVPLIRATNIHAGHLIPADIVFVDPADIPPKRIAWLRTGDIIVVRSGAYTADSAIIPCEFDGAIAGFDMVLRANDALHPQFGQYALLSDYVKSAQLELASTRAAQPHLNAEELGSCTIGLPTLPEQRAIAAFLDRETAKIDALVAEQERLIELLAEKRQAVISHAVTKGLDPAAPMKPSGVEWLGDVPAHWDVGSVKYYFKTSSGSTPNTSQQTLYYGPEEQAVPWFRTTDLNNGVLRAPVGFITSQALTDTACSLLPKGSVLVAMYGGDGTVGKNGLLAIPAAINQALCGLLPASTHRPEYTFRFMQFYRPYWMIGAESSRKDPNISQEQVRNARMLAPPIDEQEMIVRFLDSRLASFDTLADEASRAITLFRERRSALISAAVTGQIDVRNAVPESAA